MYKDKILHSINAAILELENIKEYYPAAQVNTHIIQLLKDALETRKAELSKA